jgi:tetratricopeptide (TPR) repeat protein
MKAISVVLLALAVATTATAQIDEALRAMDRSDNVAAVRILSDTLATNPSAEVYLTLGTVYERMKDFRREEDILKEGSLRYPQDPRFHNQLADLALENNDREAAKIELHRALDRDPNNSYASDLLATIDMSEGEVQSALRTWNRSGRPLINDILHNYYLTFGSWVVRDAVAFHPSGVLRYSQWKTTESRLLETDNFTNVGLEIEPTTVPDQYNAVLRTTTKTNALPNFLFDAVKGAPFTMTFFNWWNIANSGTNFNADYRWGTGRRREDSQLNIPVPLAGLLQLQVGDWWRFERWDVSSQIQPALRPFSRFDYKATALRAHVKLIPQYRVQLGAGFEYRNRTARGNLPQLFTNNLKTGIFSAEANIRLVDRDYQSMLQLAGFAARRSIIGDTHFSGGTAELDNRVTLSKDTRTYLDWMIKAGTSRGLVPIEDYFALGLDIHPKNPLRAHTLFDHGHYGNGPLGTEFVLTNTDLERRLATLPFFNTVNIPYITVKWQVFFDTGKTWDRNHILLPSQYLLDVGGGVRFETPTHAFNLIYGRALREGSNVLFGYYERRLW